MNIAVRACLVALATFLPVIAFPQSESQDRRRSLDDGYGDAFVNYQPYVKKVDAPASAPVQTSQPPQKPTSIRPDEDKGAVTVKWLRENFPRLQERAINDPSEANVTAMLLVQRLIFDKSQRYSDAVTRVVNSNPLVNENNRVPFASSGSRAVANAKYSAEINAVRELKSIGGIFVFVDGTCRFCAMQLPIVNSLKSNYGLEYVVVSIDGARPKGFAGQVVKDNGMFRKLGLKLTPSIVFIPNPKGYAGLHDPNDYFIISQGFYAQDELVKQIAFAGHNTKLLSEAVMRDLDVWDRGVASSRDLQSLRLDAEDPQSIIQAVEPMLFKRYTK